MPDSLGYLLKRFREKKHFTQSEVIERSGIGSQFELYQQPSSLSERKDIG